MKVSKVNKFAASIFAVVALAANTASADQLEDIKGKGELVCGTLGASRGFSFVDQKDRKLVGYEIDLCNEIARSLNVKPVLKTLAAAARIPELQQGKVDIILGELTRTEERQKVVDFSNPYFEVASKIMTKKQDHIDALSDLAGKKVMLTKGSTMEQIIREKVPGATVVSFDNTTQAFLAFAQGKGQAYFVDEIGLLTSRSAIGEQGKDMVILPQTLSVEQLGAGVKKGETNLLSQVNKVFANLEREGKAEALFNRWFGQGTDINYERREFKIDGSNNS